MSEGPGRRFALLGDPVSHSVSPAMHRAAFRHWEIEAAYDAVRAGPDELEPLVREFAASGGGNVTLPYKERAAELLGDATEPVRATGACNCFWSDAGGRLCGDNTDVGGFLDALAHHFGLEPVGARVLVLGAGGAARAVAYACRTAGAAGVEVANRTASRAEELASRILAATPGDAGGLPRTLRVVSRSRAEGPYDLVVNATSLGMRPTDPLPLDLTTVDVGHALDLVYGPTETRWIRQARQIGIEAADGVEMLVRQASRSLERWFPGLDPPIDAMRAAALAASGRSKSGGDDA